MKVAVKPDFHGALEELGRFCSANPGLALALALGVLALSGGDLMEGIPLLSPLAASPFFPFFHEIHDLLALGLALYAAYRWHPAVGSGAISLFLLVHAPYALLKYPENLVELFRITFLFLIALAGIRLMAELHRTIAEYRRAVTETSRAREAAIRRESLRLLGEIAAGVAHDLNNLCAVVVGYASLAKKRAGDPLEVERSLGFIMEAALTGGETIKRIATFGRLRQPSEERAPVEIHSLLQDVLALSRPRWRDDALERGVEISVETELAPVPPLSANESEMKEVFFNLILNAVDAMPSGGTLTLRTYRDDRWAVAEVADTGVGMSEEVQARAFDPFFTTKEEKGTGLGLAIAHTVVEAHGGRIGIESRPGQGTIVRVRLPIGEAQALTPAVAPLLSPGALTVLVVEDQPDVRRLMVQMLEGEGHAVRIAASGDEGLARAAEGGVDLVMTDLAMPGLSGLDLARQIRKRYSGLPVVLVTGYADLIDESARRSVDAVLRKPFTPNQLLQAINEAAWRRLP